MTSEIEALIESLRFRNMTMSAAESCTGGMISSAITDVPGASEVFLGSAVTYSNDSKENVLGVSHDTLLGHGAVSKETAEEMVEGALRVFGSDCAVAVTGIAGPGGATDEKPVGLVYISVSDGKVIKTIRSLYEGDRASVRSKTVSDAVRLLRGLLEGSE